MKMTPQIGNKKTSQIEKEPNNFQKRIDFSKINLRSGPVLTVFPPMLWSIGNWSFVWVQTCRSFSVNSLCHYTTGVGNLSRNERCVQNSLTCCLHTVIVLNPLFISFFSQLPLSLSSFSSPFSSFSFRASLIFSQNHSLFIFLSSRQRRHLFCQPKYVWWKDFWLPSSHSMPPGSTVNTSPNIQPACSCLSFQVDHDPQTD